MRKSFFIIPWTEYLPKSPSSKENHRCIVSRSKWKLSMSEWMNFSFNACRIRVLFYIYVETFPEDVFYIGRKLRSTAAALFELAPHLLPTFFFSNPHFFSAASSDHENADRLRKSIIPTDPFTILEPQNPSIDDFQLHNNRLLTNIMQLKIIDFEVLK